MGQVRRQPSSRLRHLSTAALTRRAQISGLYSLRLLQVAGSTLSSACQSVSITPSHVLSAMGVKAELANAAIRMSLGALSNDADIDRVAELFPALIAKARGLAGVA